MWRRPPRSTLTVTLLPYMTLVRSQGRRPFAPGTEGRCAGCAEEGEAQVGDHWEHAGEPGPHHPDVDVLAGPLGRGSGEQDPQRHHQGEDRESTRLNSSH